MNESADYSSRDHSASGRELRIPDDCAGLRLDQALARLFPAHSRSRLQGWLKAGIVSVDGGQRDSKHRVCGGETVRVIEPSPPEDTSDRPEDIPLNVLYEDDALLVIDKPAGLVVHPGSGNRSGTLLNALLHHAPQLSAVPRAGIVHRLDKDTSGLMVVARTVEAQTELVRQMQARSIRRHYLAVVHGDLEGPGQVEEPIGRHPLQRTRMAVVRSGRPALTHYIVHERFGRASLVECRLETGRTHQIRVHMASIGHPLVGDRTYGLRRGDHAPLGAFPRQALHAFRLGLRHPLTRLDTTWESNLPPDIVALLADLRGGSE